MYSTLNAVEVYIGNNLVASSDWVFREGISEEVTLKKMPV